MEARKIVLIGAGSAVFTRSLVADLIRDGGRWRVGLVDINPEALAVALGLAERMVAMKHAPIEVVASQGRRDLLPGADVVVTTIAVGGRRGWEKDVAIPRRYGIYQPVGDSVSIGGIFRALRMIPAMVEIARDIVALCPQALFINYSNPMSAICRAIRKATGAEVVGLCHGVLGVHNYLARYLGLRPAELKTVAVGVNHLTWFTELSYRGRDAWPLVDARLQASPPKDNPFSWGLYRTFRAFPAVLDRHVTEFFPSMLRERAYYGQTLGTDLFSVEATIAQGDARYEEMRQQATGQASIEEAVFDRPEGEGEQLLEILHAIWGDSGAVFSVNLPNTGQVSNLPRDVVLESPAMATRTGLKPLVLGELSAGLAAIMQRVVAVQELTVEAALRRERRLVVQAVLADGAIADPVVAWRLVDEMLAAHAGYMPSFA